MGIINLLCDKYGAEVKKPDDRGNSPLHDACEHGEIDVVRLMLGKGADVNQTNRKGEAALATACDEGHVTIAKLLLENGADATLT